MPRRLPEGEVRDALARDLRPRSSSRRLLSALVLVAGAALIAAHHRELRAAWEVRGLDSSDRFERTDALERLALIGEPGLAAIEAWLDAAAPAERARGYLELAEWTLREPEKARWSRRELARLLAWLAGSEDLFPSCGRFSNTTIMALAGLKAEGALAIAERLEDLNARSEPLSPRMVLTLVTALESLYPAEKERLAPVLDGLWRRAPQLIFIDEDLFPGPIGESLDSAALAREALERFACQYRGLDIWEAQEREGAARTALTRIAAGQEWLAARRGSAAPHLDLAELQQSLRAEALWRPCLPEELWRLPATPGYALSIVLEDGGRSWRGVARRVGAGARFDFVVTAKRELGAYLEAPMLAASGMPPGARAVEALDPYHFERVLSYPCTGEPSPHHPPCRDLERFRYRRGPAMTHGELAAVFALLDLAKPPSADAPEDSGSSMMDEETELVAGGGGWHAGYRFELGGEGRGRASPLLPGLSGRFDFELRGDGRLRVFSRTPLGLVSHLGRRLIASLAVDEDRGEDGG